MQFEGRHHGAAHRDAVLALALAPGCSFLFCYFVIFFFFLLDSRKAQPIAGTFR